MNFGVLGGLNLANVDVEPLEEGIEMSSITVFGFGGVLDYNLKESISFYLELMYLQKGAKSESDGEDIKIKAAYLEVPVMLKYAYANSETKPYIIAGPTIGFNLSAKRTISVSNISIEDDIKNDMKSIEFGLGFGAGVNLPVGDNSIFLEARYALGLTSINDDPEDPNTDVKTKGIQIFAGITFPLGSK